MDLRSTVEAHFESMFENSEEDVLVRQASTAWRQGATRFSASSLLHTPTLHVPYFGLLSKLRREEIQIGRCEQHLLAFTDVIQ